MNHLIVLTLLLLISHETNAQQSWWSRAHAHNDYYHKRPLLDALDQGFSSVEADVFLKDGKLLVAHSFLELRSERTLKKLYLDPLIERLELEQENQTLPNQFLLLVDFKNDGPATLKVLNEQLAPLAKHLTRLKDGKVIPGKMMVVISGNRPTREIAKAKNRLVFLDGRLGDPKEWGSDISPLISESWKSHFKYRGIGDMTPEESLKLRSMVEMVHQQEKRIRFWALPDLEKGWKAAFDSGVDLINTDKLQGLREFLQKQKK